MGYKVPISWVINAKFDAKKSCSKGRKKPSASITVSAGVVLSPILHILSSSLRYYYYGVWYPIHQLVFTAATTTATITFVDVDSGSTPSSSSVKYAVDLQNKSGRNQGGFSSFGYANFPGRLTTRHENSGGKYTCVHNANNYICNQNTPLFIPVALQYHTLPCFPMCSSRK